MPLVEVCERSSPEKDTAGLGLSSGRMLMLWDMHRDQRYRRTQYCERREAAVLYR